MKEYVLTSPPKKVSKVLEAGSKEEVIKSFSALADDFATYFNNPIFPKMPDGLYDPCKYFLGIGGKRIRPVSCLLGNQVFGDIHPDAWNVATAIELFHNFTLIHDDIMDQSDMRRGRETVHKKFGPNSGILSGDVMLIVAYEYLNKICTELLPRTLTLFNKTAKEVCEGQQMDMDFETTSNVKLGDYIEMIRLKTSVLLAASFAIGAILGDASQKDCDLLYEFGLNLGIGFQLQDDYLDAFGDSKKFGKNIGGDIRRNKKTFLWLYAIENASPAQKAKIESLMPRHDDEKVTEILALFHEIGVEAWASTLKKEYAAKALNCINAVNVADERKQPLIDLIYQLLQRDI